MAVFHVSSLPSPVGDVALAVNAEGALAALVFGGETELRPMLGADACLKRDARGLGARVAGELREYFASGRRVFSAPPAPVIGTAFQRRVWTALLRIPFGTTWSYARLAAETGSVARAVGQANGANPLCVVVPCHRVIAADGTLGGYSGGLERKRWLLRHEGVAVAG